jgi:hypothetical protein
MVIFDYETIKDKGQEIIEKINADYKAITISTLGGIDNVSIIIHISLDKKETWQNGIFHNSRYYIIHIDKNGTVENFSCNYILKKMRKKTVKTLQEALDYINSKIKGEEKNG